VSNALLKSTKEQNSFFPKEKYIAIRECKTKILSTVENPLLNPVCAPEIRTPIEKSNRPIVYHVVRLPMRFKQGELKVSRHMYFEWSTRFVFK
jgi:hypothetical protein